MRENFGAFFYCKTINEWDAWVDGFITFRPRCERY